MIGAALCLFPFVFMIIKSLSSVFEATAFPPVWIPSRLRFLNYSIAWSTAAFGPSVRVVDEAGIREAYIEFWSVVFVLGNLLLAILLVGFLLKRVEWLQERPNTVLLVAIVLFLPSLILLLFGTPARIGSNYGFMPITPDGGEKPLEILGFDTEWSYQPPPEFLTSWEADRSLVPAFPITIGEFAKLASQHEFQRGSVLNTVIVAGITMPTVIITSILAAYAFAQLEFFGKNLLFALFLSTIMIPFEAVLIPNFIIVAGAFQWHDTFKALTVPFFVSVFNIFLLRQFFKSIPQDYFDAARLDGASHFGFLRYVVIPMSRSPLSVVGLFTFLGVWNSFQWPLIAVRDAHQLIQVGMSGFRSEGGSDPQLIMAAATFSILPVVVLYFLAQKTFVESVASSGLKG
jgi:ABC-type glycerol-3-phosphate transport system permease component